MKNGIGFAEFRFGTDEKSKMMFSKIKESLIDSTSIRASGTTKRAKINNEVVDVVESLEIASVDWVLEGGVSAARVSKVFESHPNITEIVNPKKEEKLSMTEQEIQKFVEREKKNAEYRAEYNRRKWAIRQELKRRGLL